MTDHERARVHAWLTLAFDAATPTLRHLYTTRALRAARAAIEEPEHVARIDRLMSLVHDERAYRALALDARRWLAIEMRITAMDHGPGAGLLWSKP